jgi:hypothetical protein
LIPTRQTLLEAEATGIETAFTQMLGPKVDRAALVKAMRALMGTDPRWGFQRARLEAEALSLEQLLEKLEPRFRSRDLYQRMPDEEWNARLALNSELRNRLGAAPGTFPGKNELGTWFRRGNAGEMARQTARVLVKAEKFGLALKAWQKTPAGSRDGALRGALLQAEGEWRSAIIRLYDMNEDYKAPVVRDFLTHLSKTLPGEQFKTVRGLLPSLPLPAEASKSVLPADPTFTVSTQTIPVKRDEALSDRVREVTDDSGLTVQAEKVDFYRGREPGEVGFIVCENGKCSGGAMANIAARAKADGSPVELTDTLSGMEAAARTLKKKGAKVIVVAGHGSEDGLAVDGLNVHLDGTTARQVAPAFANLEGVYFESCSLSKCKPLRDSFSLWSGVPAFYIDQTAYAHSDDGMLVNLDSNWYITTPGDRKVSLKAPAPPLSFTQRLAVQAIGPTLWVSHKLVNWYQKR